ncbi:MAG: hypothetical protein E6042_10460 [Haemophilus parainfluenzae]|nr:hypothetical protein [Haemophilus parainfluenzae]
MTTIKINEQANEQKKPFFNQMHAEFKMIDETTATVSGFATIKFDYDVEDTDQVKTEQEIAADICERHTNIQIMQALALMDYKKVDDFDKLPKYITEFEESLKSGEPMDFYPFVASEKELRGYLEDEFVTGDVDEHLKEFGDQYIYSPLGALFLNR